MNSARLTGVIVEDPLHALPVGSILYVKPVVFSGSDAAVVPEGVTDWTFFDGALLTILVGDSSQSEAMGTAIMVAPGLAITATHVLPKDLDEVMAGKVGLLCVGPTRAGVDLWRVRSVTSTPGDDAAHYLWCSRRRSPTSGRSRHSR